MAIVRGSAGYWIAAYTFSCIAGIGLCTGIAVITCVGVIGVLAASIRITAVSGTDIAVIAIQSIAIKHVANAAGELACFFCCSTTFSRGAGYCILPNPFIRSFRSVSPVYAGWIYHWSRIASPAFYIAQFYDLRGRRQHVTRTVNGRNGEGY